MKHYERAYLDRPLSVTLYPIAPFPNKQPSRSIEREREGEIIAFVNRDHISFCCGHVSSLYWLHSTCQIVCRKSGLKRKISKDIPYRANFAVLVSRKDNMHKYVSCKLKWEYVGRYIHRQVCILIGWISINGEFV